MYVSTLVVGIRTSVAPRPAARCTLFSLYLSRSGTHNHYQAKYANNFYIYGKAMTFALQLRIFAPISFYIIYLWE